MTLELPSDRWLTAASVRRSRRSFDGTPVSEADILALERLSAQWRPYPSARAVLLRRAPQSLFAGIVGSYGGVSGSPSAFVFVGTESGRDVQEAVGYTGEGLILESAALGLDTCWVGGLFSGSVAARLAGLETGERVYAISALGHAAEKITAKERLIYAAARAKRRRALAEIAPGSDGWPEWAVRGLESVRVAPSATNRQPWRFRREREAIIVSVDGIETPRVTKRLDCGIAMLHFELGARAEGCRGDWERLDAPDVARWVPTS